VPPSRTDTRKTSGDNCCNSAQLDAERRAPQTVAEAADHEQAAAHTLAFLHELQLNA
jgi:hypothetical protein